MNGWGYGIGNGDDGGRGGREKSERTAVQDASRASTTERDNEKNAFHRARSSWSGLVGCEGVASSGGGSGGGGGRSQSRDASAEYTLESGAFRHRQRTASTTSPGRDAVATGSDFGAVENRPLLGASALNTRGDTGWRGGQHGQFEEGGGGKGEGGEEATPQRIGTVGAGEWKEAHEWESAPDYGIRGHEMKGRRGAGWRSRGARGRRPATREAVRQLHESERMHRLGFSLSKKRESARRRRDDLQQARVIL